MNLNPGGDLVALPPCSWTGIVPAEGCCDCWNGIEPPIQAKAINYASLTMWASTGRQFGLCEVTIRPCGTGSPCSDGSLVWSGFSYSGGGWIPYLFNGTWFNCGCPGQCSCDPRCQVMLPERVDSVTSVVIGGATLDPSAYRVDKHRWLVRTDGDCWPTCPEMNADTGTDVFTVSYLRGTPVPQTILDAAGTLACEFGKACTNQSDCRLPSRVQTLARQGVTVSFVDVDTLLDKGLTGITEVDMVIRAWNPRSLDRRLRVASPDLRLGRIVTSP